jgi:hypothetical protein
MASPQPESDKARLPSEPLHSLLGQADTLLEHLRRRAENILGLEDPTSIGFYPRQLKTLCGIIDQGRARIQLHVETRDLATGRDDEAPDRGPTTPMADPIAFMAEYRASCRLLCRALSEALRTANAPTGAMLSDLVLRLEKQLWLVGPKKKDTGSDRYSSVSLFLTC